MRHKRSHYWDQILIYIVLSIALLTFYLAWNNTIIGLIVSLILFFLILGRDKINLFKSLAQFRSPNLLHLFPVLLEWSIALPIQFMMLSNANLDIHANVGSKVLLNSFFMQLLLNIREEVATSFCWLMIAFLIMRLLRIKSLNKFNLKFALVAFSFLFVLGHLPNLITTINYPGLDATFRLIGAIYVFINAFILGLYLKTTYIQTRSIQLCIAIHFLLDLRRVFFSITSQLFGPITLEQIGYESIILVIYIVAIIVLWRKQWPLKELNEVYAAQDANPFELHA